MAEVRIVGTVVIRNGITVACCRLGQVGVLSFVYNHAHPGCEDVQLIPWIQGLRLTIQGYKVKNFKKAFLLAALIRLN